MGLGAKPVHVTSPLDVRSDGEELHGAAVARLDPVTGLPSNRHGRLDRVGVVAISGAMPARAAPTICAFFKYQAEGGVREGTLVHRHQVPLAERPQPAERALTAAHPGYRRGR